MLTSKANTFCLYKVLYDYSDADNILTRADIDEKLMNDYGITMNRHTLSSCITVLENMGFVLSIYEDNGKGYYLETREFEPDAPNYTPRISGMITFKDNDFTYEMAILKSADEKGSSCNRFHYMYSPINGLGHFIHTYVCNDDPCPTFVGEPERVVLNKDIDSFTLEVWNSLDKNNRISLYTTYTDLSTGKTETRLINKNK